MIPQSGTHWHHFRSNILCMNNDNTERRKSQHSETTQKMSDSHERSSSGSRSTKSYRKSVMLTSMRSSSPVKESGGQSAAEQSLQSSGATGSSGTGGGGPTRPGVIKAVTTTSASLSSSAAAVATATSLFASRTQQSSSCESHCCMLSVPFLGRAPMKTVPVPKAFVEQEPPTVRTAKTVLCSYKAISEEIQSRKTVIKQEAASYKEETIGKYRQVQLNRICLNLPSHDSDAILIQALIRTPSGLCDRGFVTRHPDDEKIISIKYDPKEEGLHEISVKGRTISENNESNEPILLAPVFKVYVDTMSGSEITAFGPGLTHGTAGEPCYFTVNTKNCGPGGLQVAIEGTSRTEIMCHDNKDGTVGVNYVPETPGEYKIIVRFAGQEIKGSPFTSVITGESKKRMHVSVGSQSEVSLKISEKDIRNLSATIVTPGNIEEPCIIKKLSGGQSGQLGISFVPRDSGQHFVNVKRGNQHIAGSPFMINVLEREIGDASKVRVSGLAVKEGITQMDNEFTIDTKEAGYGGLSLSIEGPSKAGILCKDNQDGTLTISYRPTEPGFYILNIKFADQHVPGSPFTIKVIGQGSSMQQEMLKQAQQALPVTDVGCECKLTFKMRGTSISNMQAKVTSPSGRTETARVVDMSDCLYGVAFIPKEVGVHTVSVRYKDMHIPGSPFQFTVGPLRDYGAHRVHAGGPGLERGIVREPCEFNVWTREAGAGNLSLSVEGPSKAEIDFKDRKDGSCHVSYRVTEPGDYKITIKFNDQHIPESPYKVYVMPQITDAKKIELGPMPVETSLHVNIPITIKIRMNGAKGHLDAKYVTPTGFEDDCFISAIDEDTYSLRFVPKENGVHTVHVRFNGIHIPNSPFKLGVGKDDRDPGCVSAFGPGLTETYAGVKTEFTIDTSNAGHGNLSVTVDGPSKVAMDCSEVNEGYKVRYTPVTAGDYYITVKYNAYHIAGSPFRVRCLPSAAIQHERTIPIEQVHSGPPPSRLVTTLTQTQSLKQVSSSSSQQQTSSRDTRDVQQLQERLDKQRLSSIADPVVLQQQAAHANKVTASGVGLSKAFVGKNNSFTVNCSNAGPSCLFASMYGPGGPCDLNLKHMGANIYTVNYRVSDRGTYTVHVKWGDEHIPGSPFKIEAV